MNANYKFGSKIGVTVVLRVCMVDIIFKVCVNFTEFSSKDRWLVNSPGDVRHPDSSCFPEPTWQHEDANAIS